MYRKSGTQFRETVAVQSRVPAVNCRRKSDPVNCFPVAICLEGAIIVLGCIIFSVFAASPAVVDESAAAVNQVWFYIGELIFNIIVLVGTVKMSDRVVKEMMGL